MRAGSVALVLAGALSASACSFLNPSGSAASRWANLEKTRAMKADPQLAAKQVCKSMKITGSNLPTRVCSTQAEWDAREELERQAAEDFNTRMRDGNVAPGTDGG